MFKISLPPSIASFFQPNPLAISPLRLWLAPLAYLGIVLVMVGVTPLHLPPGLGQNTQFLGYVVLATLLPLLCVRPVLRWHLGLDSSSPGFWQRTVGFTLLGLAIVLVISYSFIFLSAEVKESTAVVMRSMGFGEGVDSDIWSVITVTVGGPLAEEAAYRVLIFRSLYDGLRHLGKTRFHRWLPPGLSLTVALLISGAIFASIHGSPGQEAQQLALCLHGMIFAWIYERSGSIFASVMSHCLNNCLALSEYAFAAANSEIIISTPAKLVILAAPLITLVLLFLWQRCVPQGSIFSTSNQ